MTQKIFVIALLLIHLSCGNNKDNTQDPKINKEENKRSEIDDTTDQMNPAWPADSQKLYSQPKELLFTGKRELFKYPGPMYPKFFPIGWSEAGLIAYAEEPPDEACGCYFFNIFIQDLITDKIVWQWKYTGDGLVHDSMDLKKLWSKNIAMFSAQLQKQRISPRSFSKLEKFPIKLNDNSYSLYLKNKTIQTVEQEAIGTSSIFLIVNGKTKAKIFDKNYVFSEIGSQPYSVTFTNKILGYTKSPFENRIAIFYMAENKGWEGPPNVIKLNLIGCSLD